MATGPDLSVARVVVEALMDDTCVITRDEEKFSDDVLDPVTGRLTPPTPDTITVYDSSTTGAEGRALGGRCKVSPQNTQPSERLEGGAEVNARMYNGSIPWDAPMPKIGDLLLIASSYRDPQLVGKTFKVQSVEVSTFLVSRRMQLELR